MQNNLREEQMTESSNSSTAEISSFDNSFILKTIFDKKDKFERVVDAFRNLRLTTPIHAVPLCWVEDNPDEIKFYPNIRIKFREPFKIQSTLSPSSLRSKHGVPFELIRNQFNSEISDPVRSRRWADPDRVYGRVETTTIARFMRNVLGMSDLGMRDDEIRDYAQKVVNWFKPPELIFCQTPEDYVDMFSVNAFTCMTHNSTHMSQVAKDILRDTGYFSSMWFHFNPHTQGVYIRKNGKAVARAMIVRSETNENFRHYTNIIASTNEFRASIEGLLRQAGYVCNNGDYYQVSIKEKFSVPAFEYKNKKYCPLPFHDSVKSNYAIVWNEGANAFEFSPVATKTPNMPSVQSISPYDFHGMIEVESFKARAARNR